MSIEDSNVDVFRLSETLNPELCSDLLANLVLGEKNLLNYLRDKCMQNYVEGLANFTSTTYVSEELEHVIVRWQKLVIVYGVLDKRAKLSADGLREFCINYCFNTQEVSFNHPEKFFPMALDLDFGVNKIDKQEIVCFLIYGNESKVH